MVTWMLASCTSNLLAHITLVGACANLMLPTYTSSHCSLTQVSNALNLL